jgi:thioredoxin reductase (NADPH)
VRAIEFVQDRVRANPRITVRRGIETLAFEARDHRLGAIVARELETGREIRLEPAAAFVFVGLDPNTAFLTGSVTLDGRGFVLTDDRFRTSMAGLYAAGDARAGSTKQVASAAGKGSPHSCRPGAGSPNGAS